MSRANFKATVKDFKKNGKQMELKLLISKEDIDPQALMSALDMVDSKIHVYLGDPQMSFNFSEDTNYPPRRLNIVTDQSGVVTKVSGDNEDDEDDYDDTDDLETESDEDEANDQDEDEEKESSEQETDYDDEVVDVESEVEEVEVEGDDPEIEQQSQEESDDKTNEGDQEANKQDDAVAAIDKEALEAFILSGQAPVFDEFTFDFPELLQRKKSGETWVIIAKSLGVSSTKVAAELREYKKRVAEHMAKQNGEEPGAA